jgi:TRAP-type transport system periplasmic protein
MNWFKTAIISTLYLSLTSTALLAQEATLRFGTQHPPSSDMNVSFFDPWTNRVNEQGAGVLKIDIRYGPAFLNAGNYYERVTAGVAQIAWGVQSTLVHKFKKASVATLPFLADKSEYASLAYWRLYKSGMLDDEYAGDLPLYVNVFPQSGLHFNRGLNSVETLKGLKIIGGGATGAEIIEALGATPLSLRVDEAYEALQRGTADGLRMMYTAFPIFKLHEVTSFHVDANLGSGSGWVFMQKKVFDGLTAKQRDILIQNSGEQVTRDFGKYWDHEEEQGRQRISSDSKHKLVQLSPQQAAAWKKHMETVTNDWLKSTPGGDKVLAAFKTELDKVTPKQ